MNDGVRMLRLAEVLQIVGVSKSRLYKMIRNREFPGPHKLRSGRISRWRNDEVRRWLDDETAGAAA